MSTAREIMTGGVECASVNETLVEAAKKMKDLEVGALPICGEDNELQGVVTDRDIVVEASPMVVTRRRPRSRSWHRASQ